MKIDFDEALFYIIVIVLGIGLLVSACLRDNSRMEIYDVCVSNYKLDKNTVLTLPAYVEECMNK